MKLNTEELNREEVATAHKIGMWRQKQGRGAGGSATNKMAMSIQKSRRKPIGENLAGGRDRGVLKLKPQLKPIPKKSARSVTFPNEENSNRGMDCMQWWIANSTLLLMNDKYFYVLEHSHDRIGCRHGSSFDGHSARRNRGGWCGDDTRTEVAASGHLCQRSLPLMAAQCSSSSCWHWQTDTFLFQSTEERRKKKEIVFFQIFCSLTLWWISRSKTWHSEAKISTHADKQLAASMGFFSFWAFCTFWHFWGQKTSLSFWSKNCQHLYLGIASCQTNHTKLNLDFL